jgi:hypothetical protein
VERSGDNVNFEPLHDIVARGGSDGDYSYADGDSYSQPMIINFYDRAGIQVGSFLVNSTEFNIPISNLGKGIYFYRISDATHPLIDAGKIMVL